MDMEKYYYHTTGIISKLKTGEALYKYVFWDKFISSKALNKLTTKTGVKIEDDFMKAELMFLAEKIFNLMCKQHPIDINITLRHFLALLKNEGRKKLTKRKQRIIKGMVMRYCMDSAFVPGKLDRICQKCKQSLIMVYVDKGFLRQLGRKPPPGNMKVQITKCGCGEMVNLYLPGEKNYCKWTM